MKKKVMLGVIAAMVVSMSATVFAAPSIGQIIPENPEIITSTLYDEWKLSRQLMEQMKRPWMLTQRSKH